MSVRAAALADQVRAAGAALIAIVGRIDDAAWIRVPADGVWSPGKDAEHVTQGAAYHQWLVRSALGDTSERTARTERDIMVALVSKAEVLDLLQQSNERSALLVQGLTDAQLDLPAPTFGPDGPPRSVAELIEGQMIDHYREHRENIEAKIGVSS